MKNYQAMTVKNKQFDKMRKKTVILDSPLIKSKPERKGTPPQMVQNFSTELRIQTKEEKKKQESESDSEDEELRI